MNITKAEVGQVVRYVETPAAFNMTTGKLYFIYGETNNGESTGSKFFDDKGNNRAFWNPSDYEIVGNLQDMQAPLPKLEDLMGKELKEGDTIAYPVSVDRMEVLRIESINRHGLTAVCTYVGSPISGSITVGCLDKRAIKLVER